MLPRTLEPEVMDTIEEAVDYDAMDHSMVNRLFVDDLLKTAEQFGQARGTSAIPVRVLDVGTGTALIPIELCRRVLGCRVWAIDLAAEMLKLAEKNLQQAALTERVTLQLVDAKSMPFASGMFDWVISNSIVHHIPDPRHTLSEMLRTVRAGGLLFVRDLLRPNSAEDVEQIVQTYAGNENDHQRQLFRQSLHAALTVPEIRELAVSLGIQESCVQQTSDRHWTLAAHRPMGSR